MGVYQEGTKTAFMGGVDPDSGPLLIAIALQPSATPRTGSPGHTMTGTSPPRRGLMSAAGPRATVPMEKHQPAFSSCISLGWKGLEQLLDSNSVIHSPGVCIGTSKKFSKNQSAAEMACL